jgi:large subunit ribosomal protein L14
MVCKGSILKSVDNSGSTKIYCLRIINNFNKVKGLFKGILKKKINLKKLQKKRIYYGLVVSINQLLFREDGFIIKCDDNSAIILNNNFKMLGSRIYGPILKEIFYIINRKDKKIDMVKRSFYRKDRFV